MLLLILSISCLITSNLLWFTNLTFQVLMQYCSLQHWTLPSPPDTSTTEWRFYISPASSFFLELFLCSSPIAYWTPIDLGGLSSYVISFCLLLSSWGSWGKNTEVVCCSLLRWTMFYQALTSRDMPFSHSTWLDDVPGALVVPFLVLVFSVQNFTGSPVSINMWPGV